MTKWVDMCAGLLSSLFYRMFLSSFYIVLFQCVIVSLCLFTVYSIPLRLQRSVSGQAVTMNSPPVNLDCCIGNAASSVLTTLMILALVSMSILPVTTADISLSRRLACFYQPSCADSVRKITVSMPRCLGLLRRFLYIPALYIRGWFTMLPQSALSNLWPSVDRYMLINT